MQYEKCNIKTRYKEYKADIQNYKYDEGAIQRYIEIKIVKIRHIQKCSICEQRIFMKYSL